MDCLKLESDMMKNIIARIIRKKLKKKFGCDISVDFKNFEIVVGEERATMHVNINAQMPNGDLGKLVEMITS